MATAGKAEDLTGVPVYLGIREFSEATGITYRQAERRHKNGRLPVPEVEIVSAGGKSVYGWSEETAKAWAEDRSQRREGATTAPYMGLSAFGEYVGLSLGSMTSYKHKGLTPKPDVVIQRGDFFWRGWSRETIDEWMANRPGRGARTDLYDK